MATSCSSTTNWLRRKAWSWWVSHVWRYPTIFYRAFVLWSCSFAGQNGARQLFQKRHAGGRLFRSKWYVGRGEFWQKLFHGTSFWWKCQLSLIRLMVNEYLLKCTKISVPLFLIFCKRKKTKKLFWTALVELGTELTTSLVVLSALTLHQVKASKMIML